MLDAWKNQAQASAQVLAGGMWTGFFFSTIILSDGDTLELDQRLKYVSR
jgi:hypothetical protein